jgi:hypothetical protein
MSDTLPPNSLETGPIETDLVPGSYSLVVCTPDGTRAVPIASDRSYTIGRGANADIRLDYPWVSNEHAISMAVIHRDLWTWGVATDGGQCEIDCRGVTLELRHESVVPLARFPFLSIVGRWQTGGSGGVLRAARG